MTIINHSITCFITNECFFFTQSQSHSKIVKGSFHYSNNFEQRI